MQPPTHPQDPPVAPTASEIEGEIRECVFAKLTLAKRLISEAIDLDDQHSVMSDQDDVAALHDALGNALGGIDAYGDLVRAA